MLTRVHGEGACEPFPLPPAPTVYMHDVSNNQLCQAPSPIAMRAQAARAVCAPVVAAILLLCCCGKQARRRLLFLLFVLLTPLALDGSLRLAARPGARCRPAALLCALHALSRNNHLYDTIDWIRYHFR